MTVRSFPVLCTVHANGTVHVRISTGSERLFSKGTVLERIARPVLIRIESLVGAIHSVRISYVSTHWSIWGSAKEATVSYMTLTARTNPIADLANVRETIRSVIGITETKLCTRAHPCSDVPRTPVARKRASGRAISGISRVVLSPPKNTPDLPTIVISRHGDIEVGMAVSGTSALQKAVRNVERKMPVPEQNP